MTISHGYGWIKYNNCFYIKLADINDIREEDLDSHIQNHRIAWVYQQFDELNIRVYQYEDYLYPKLPYLYLGAQQSDHSYKLVPVKLYYPCKQLSKYELILTEIKVFFGMQFLFTVVLPGEVFPDQELRAPRFGDATVDDIQKLFELFDAESLFVRYNKCFEALNSQSDNCKLIIPEDHLKLFNEISDRYYKDFFPLPPKFGLQYYSSQEIADWIFSYTLDHVKLTHQLIRLLRMLLLADYIRPGDILRAAKRFLYLKEPIVQSRFFGKWWEELSNFPRFYDDFDATIFDIGRRMYEVI